MAATDTVFREIFPGTNAYAQKRVLRDTLLRQPLGLTMVDCQRHCLLIPRPVLPRIATRDHELA